MSILLSRFSVNRIEITYIIRKKAIWIFSLFWGLWCINPVYGQDATLFGIVRDIDTNEGVDFVSVHTKDGVYFTETDSYGQYKIKLPSNQDFDIYFTRVGYTDVVVHLDKLKPNTNRNINIKFVPKSLDLEIIVRAGKIEDVGVVREEVTELKILPTASGNFESVLPHIALGVSSGAGGELTSQYNVRGGNYDENLVYVNDFEIFRPQLIRSGQQEGLSFPNIDLIRDLEFSSGGFEARYGDKMSSVLDIRYKRPESHKYSISASLLGMSAHMEGSKKIGSNAYNKLRYLLGLRYKSNAYLLGSGDIKGEYVPRFIDIQGYVSYDLTKDVQVSFISNYNGSEYNFEPSSGTSNRGTFDFQLQLNTTFEGSEQSQFRYGMSGLGLTYVPEKSRHPLYLKLHASAYNAIEEEKFDILGFYRLSQVETGLGSNAGQEIAVLGSGTQHLYARNFLVNAIYNVEHKGGIEWRNQTSSVDRSHFLQWGVKLQRENFDDQLLEWERLDSAGYSLPYTGQAVALFNAVRTDNVVVNDRLTAFVQNSYSLENTTTVWKVTGGVRALYRSLSQEFLVSPRAQILFQPKGINKNIAFKIAGGMYHQAPLYRELRRMDGTINKDLLSQKSWQIVGGMSYDFTLERISNRPFKIISEVYYKQMYDLISYEIDNVRIRYAGQNNSDGYVLGWDFRINGEFVPGAESWLSFSFMTAREALRGINHLRYERVGEEVVESIVDNVPRPTDRLYNVNLFFQDYLPKNENVKVNLNFSFGGGLPYGPRIGNDVFRNFFRLKSYHRVDIGFSFQIWKEEWRNKKPNHPLKFSSNTWLSIEAFNLLDIANQASVNWVRTLSNIEYALPNNLTGRRVNVRMRMDF